MRKNPKFMEQNSIFLYVKNYAGMWESTEKAGTVFFLPKTGRS